MSAKDNYEQFQLDRYGNILPPAGAFQDSELYESGIEALNRIADWTDAMAEGLLIDQSF